MLSTKEIYKLGEQVILAAKNHKRKISHAVLDSFIRHRRGKNFWFIYGLKSGEEYFTIEIRSFIGGPKGILLRVVLYHRFPSWEKERILTVYVRREISSYKPSYDTVDWLLERTDLEFSRQDYCNITSIPNQRRYLLKYLESAFIKRSVRLSLWNSFVKDWWNDFD